MTEPDYDVVGCSHVTRGKAGARVKAKLSGVEHDGSPMSAELHVCGRCAIEVLDKLVAKLDDPVGFALVRQPDGTFQGEYPARAPAWVERIAKAWELRAVELLSRRERLLAGEWRRAATELRDAAKGGGT